MLGVNVLGVKIVKKVKPSTSRLKTRFENSFVLKKKLKIDHASTG